MELDELKARVMFQTNNDEDDIEDYEPHIEDYLNEGYDLLALAFTGEHLPDDMYLGDEDEPTLIPKWAHPAIADYATWLIYRNSNPIKQQRGAQFRAAFEEVRVKLASAASRNLRFTNTL